MDRTCLDCEGGLAHPSLAQHHKLVESHLARHLGDLGSVLDSRRESDRDDRQEAEEGGRLGSSGLEYGSDGLDCGKELFQRQYLCHKSLRIDGETGFQRYQSRFPEVRGTEERIYVGVASGMAPRAGDKVQMSCQVRSTVNG